MQFLLYFWTWFQQAQTAEVTGWLCGVLALGAWTMLIFGKGK